MSEAALPMRLALVGSPNCGKTALFNLLTGSRQKVANYTGVTVERKEGVDPDKVFEAALEGGAEDVKTGDAVIEVFADADQFRFVRDALHAANIKVSEAELAMIPTTQTELHEQDAEKVLNAVEMLEELDDVQTVYHNMA
jgi:transcriptional/translational regulatory protein YebC/TACO1